MPSEYDVKYCSNGFTAEKGELCYKYCDNVLTVGNEDGEIVFVKSSAEDYLDNELIICFGILLLIII